MPIASVVLAMGKKPMTENEAIHKLVQAAYGEVGYHESGNNYNKYAADPRIKQLYGWDVQGQPWCETFTAFLFINTFGYTDGTAMTYGGSASCATHAQLYKNNYAWDTEPQKGDQIYFIVNGGINHTGIVVDVSGATVTTIEGNYSDKVAVNTYYAHDQNIAGYGRPNWSVVANEQEPEPGPDEGDDSDVIHPQHRRTYFHLEYGDGIGNPKPQVKAWQDLLICWGYKEDLGKGGADGEFGSLTMMATKKWQTKVKGIGGGVEVNGIVDEDDWIEAVYVPTE